MNTPGISSLKETLRVGTVTIGSWITLAHPGIAEIMAKAGFIWLVVDLEHSVVTIREAEELIRVIELCGVTPLVRLSANDPVQIKRVMDAGAYGVIVPMVNDGEDASRAVAAVKYPPQGRRGVGLARAHGYGSRFDDYRTWLERESLVIVQVEDVKAVENLDKILSVDGIDGYLVGPYDLSCSLKVPGQFEHPSVVEALQEIRRIGAGYEAFPGYHVVQPDAHLVIQKIQEGYRFVAYGVDMLFLGEMCRRGLREIMTCR